MNAFSPLRFLTVADRNHMSLETLQLVEQVLDYIRANLGNIRLTWGVESSQYKAAAQVMDQYLDENMKRLNLNLAKKPDLDQLMGNLSLADGGGRGGGRGGGGAGNGNGSGKS